MIRFVENINEQYFNNIQSLSFDGILIIVHFDMKNSYFILFSSFNPVVEFQVIFAVYLKFIIVNDIILSFPKN